MVDNNNYLKLVYDLAGSRAKNRFRAEILWGIKRMFEIYQEGEFYAVFDYVCDIEIHTKDKLEFYQVKTHNSEQYSLTEIIRKNKAGKSVLGKLVAIKNKCDAIGEESKIEIVCNVPLKVDSKTVFNTVEEKELITLSDEIKNRIVAELSNEKDVENIDFNNTYYRYTTMNLVNPEKDIIAEIVIFIEEIKKVTAIKIMALYRLLYAKVSQKACYEFSGNNYEEIIKNKAITKQEFDNMINTYIRVTDISVEKAKTYIDSKYNNNFKQQLDMKKALTRIVKDLLCDNNLQSIEMEIVSYIKENGEILQQSIENIIEVIYNQFDKKFNLIYSNDDIKALIILILQKFMEGIYEDDNK